MLKKSSFSPARSRRAETHLFPGIVLALLRSSTYRSVRLASSLAAALLDGLVEHPASHYPIVLKMGAIDFSSCHNSFSEDPSKTCRDCPATRFSFRPRPTDNGRACRMPTRDVLFVRRSSLVSRRSQALIFLLARYASRFTNDGLLEIRFTGIENASGGLSQSPARVVRNSLLCRLFSYTNR